MGRLLRRDALLLVGRDTLISQPGGNKPVICARSRSDGLQNRFGRVTQILRLASNPHAVDVVPVQHELAPEDQLLVHAVEVIGGGAFGACSRTPTCALPVPYLCPCRAHDRLAGHESCPFVFVFVC